MVVDLKGQDPNAVRRLADWLGELGIRHFTYKSDKEPALRVLTKQAVALAKVHGVEQLPEEEQGIQAAVPEHSSPGESSSNGAAERGVQAIDGQCSVLK